MKLLTPSFILGVCACSLSSTVLADAGRAHEDPASEPVPFLRETHLRPDDYNDIHNFDLLASGFSFPVRVLGQEPDDSSKSACDTVFTLQSGWTHPAASQSVSIRQGTQKTVRVTLFEHNGQFHAVDIVPEVTCEVERDAGESVAAFQSLVLTVKSVDLKPATSKGTRATRLSWNFETHSFEPLEYAPSFLLPVSQTKQIHKLLKTSDPETLLTEAIHKLEESEALVEQLLQQLQEQDDLINQLSSSGTASQTQFPTCGITCYAKKIYEKSKDCIHKIYERVTDMVSSFKQDDCAYVMSASPAAKAKIFLNSTHKCHESLAEKQKALLVSELEIFDSDSDVDDDELVGLLSTTNSTAESAPHSSVNSHHSWAPGKKPYFKTHKLHTLLASVLGLLCLSCLATLLHRRCCSPRAKADRAARREQWRTEREYRAAARRHAWRDWWSKHGFSLARCSCCGGRKDDRQTDYEEKRALILQQEQVLEDVMQSQIRHLTRSHRLQHGVPAVTRPANVHTPSHGPFAQPHRQDSTDSQSDSGESLPSYRSRASTSPRPPSYRGSTLPTYSPVTHVPDGFAHYTPSNTVLSPHASSSASSNILSTLSEDGIDSIDFSASPRSISPILSGRGSEDATPDSSVIALSPRGSFETLRTNASMGDTR